MRVVVTGVPGVGKTTVMEAAAAKAKTKIMNFGSVMFEMAKAKGLVTKRDEIRNLPLDVNRELQENTAVEIHKAGQVIVDTHCTIKTPRGYWSGLPLHVLQKLQPDVIVLLEADSESIFRRRQGDNSRERDPDMPSDIREHQEMNRAAAMSYAMVVGGCVKIIKNNSGQVEEAATELATLFK